DYATRIDVRIARHSNPTKLNPNPDKFAGNPMGLLRISRTLYANARRHTPQNTQKESLFRASSLLDVPKGESTHSAVTRDFQRLGTRNRRAVRLVPPSTV